MESVACWSDADMTIYMFFSQLSQDAQTNMVCKLYSCHTNSAVGSDVGWEDWTSCCVKLTQHVLMQWPFQRIHWRTQRFIPYLPGTHSLCFCSIVIYSQSTFIILFLFAQLARTRLTFSNTRRTSVYDVLNSQSNVNADCDICKKSDLHHLITSRFPYRWSSRRQPRPLAEISSSSIPKAST